jgi:hypothetical protein
MDPSRSRGSVHKNPLVKVLDCRLVANYPSIASCCRGNIYIFGTAIATLEQQGSPCQEQPTLVRACRPTNSRVSRLLTVLTCHIQAIPATCCYTTGEDNGWRMHVRLQRRLQRRPRKGGWPIARLLPLAPRNGRQDISIKSYRI